MRRAGKLAPWKILLLAAFVSTGLYVLASAVEYRVGFPLDDSWIHQTYARNLAEHGEWAFLPGRPSGGSTSPLWTLFLTVGHILSTEVPYVFTFALGAGALALLAWSGQKLVDCEPGIQQSAARRWPWFGLFLAAEWHLVWAGASGMETALMAAAVMVTFWLLAAHPGRRWLAGLAIGLSAWIRPDGITLLGPAVLLTVWPGKPFNERLRSSGELLAGFLALFTPYLIFNQVLEGSWWPNTFYAKYAEYQFLMNTPLMSRFFSLAILPMIGPGLLLVPGFLYSAYQAIRQRNPVRTAGILWWLGYTLVYAMRLPVDYHHGRYLMPAMPIFFWLGWAGWQSVFQSVELRPSLQFGKRAVIILLTLAFLLTGTVTYAEDVAIIETEMVASAQWLNANVNSQELLAVHDIGAIGYFTDFDFIDLAGLASPEVIPLLGDEAALARFLDGKGVKYLVVFPDWYDQLASGLDEVYCTGGQYARAQEHTNLCVYRWLTGT